MVYEELRKTAANTCHLFLVFFGGPPSTMKTTQKAAIFLGFSRIGLVMDRERGRDAFVAG